MFTWASNEFYIYRVLDLAKQYKMNSLLEIFDLLTGEREEFFH